MENNRGSQVHVRFLNCLHKDHYILVDETEIDDWVNNRPESSDQLKILREKDIFLRAALQLIDQKQIISSLPKLRNVSSKGTTSSQTGSCNDASSTTPAKPQSQEENSMHDVIRLGYLKKSARGGAMNLTQGSALNWRRKYVELRHGLFSYDDYYGHGHQSGRFDVEELNKTDVNGANSHRRTIPLSVLTCSCRMLPHGNNLESVVFEIAVANGPKRIWMASTVEECKEWVRAINSAMVGGLYYSNMSTKLSHLSEQESLTPPIDEPRALSRKLSGSEMFGLFAYNSNSNGHDLNKIPPIDRDPNSPAVTERYIIDDKTWASIDGAAAPYVADMSLFLQLQEAFNNSDEEKDFRFVLQSLFTDGIKLTIPVLFIKSKTTHSNFILSTHDQLSVHNIRSKANQIWKDLQRDRIIVNGEEISGELGAERMLGALVRHLAEKADWIKANQDKLNSRKIRHCPMELSTPALSRCQQQQQHNPFAMEFAVSEAQIVECAKDLLVLCNRTQSGGDTYFCIEALLSGDHMKDMCILTPYSAEAEPLQFKIDIVEISQHLSSQKRKRSNTAPVTLPEFMTTSSSVQKGKLLQQLLASSSDPVDGNEAESEGEAAERQERQEADADALTTPPAMRSLPPLPAAGPRSGRITAPTKRSFTFQEIENDLFVQQQQSQLQQSALDHRPIRSSSLASNGSAPSSSNNDGMSSTPSVPISATGSRRPQLDLKRDLEIENLLGGSVWTSNPNGKSVFATTPVHSSTNQSPAMSSHPSRPSLAGSDEKKAHTGGGFHVANSQDVSVDSQQETAVVFRDHPPHRFSNQQSTEGLEPHQSQQAIRGDDFSVISELTFDTYLKHQSSRSNNGRPHSRDSNKDPLTSGEEEDGNILNGHDNLQEDEVIVDHVLSKSAKQKSLLKRIGHQLKPFKMPNMHLAEGFEGIKSPFRPKRATTDPLTYNTNHQQQPIATSQSNDVMSSSGVQSGGGSSNGVGNTSQQSTHKEPFHGIFSHISPRPMFTTRNADGLYNDHVNHSPSNNSDHDEEGASQPRLALRVQVRAFSQYRICSSNPTGIESIDSWATVAGTFYQSFLLVGDGKGQLGMADRLVTIEVDGCNRMLSEDAIVSLETGMTQQQELPRYLSGEEVDAITTAVLN